MEADARAPDIERRPHDERQRQVAERGQLRMDPVGPEDDHDQPYAAVKPAKPSSARPVRRSAPSSPRDKHAAIADDLVDEVQSDPLIASG